MMSLVTIDDRRKALAMLTNDIAPLSRRDRLLFSLARQATWTDKQRQFIEKLWSQRHAVSTR